MLGVLEIFSNHHRAVGFSKKVNFDNEILTADC